MQKLEGGVEKKGDFQRGGVRFLAQGAGVRFRLQGEGVQQKLHPLHEYG